MPVTLRERLIALIEPVLVRLGYELVELEYAAGRSQAVVRIFIDKPAGQEGQGITVDDCEQVSREIGTILDVEDPLPFAYTLEVSSPGLDRPLRGEQDYRRFAGRLAKIVVSEAVDNQTAFEGRLRGVEERTVLLEGPRGRMHRLPLQLITRARLEVEF